MLNPDIRWNQRLQNFSKAVILLNEVRELDLKKLSLLEKEGIIQRFEFSFELAWKSLKDKMENDGILLDRISPKMIIKQAYSSKYLDDIELWIRMINDRNLLSHTYDSDILEQVIPDIQKKYIPLISDLHAKLTGTP